MFELILELIKFTLCLLGQGIKLLLSFTELFNVFDNVKNEVIGQIIGISPIFVTMLVLLIKKLFQK